MYITIDWFDPNTEVYKSNVEYQIYKKNSIALG